MEEQAWKTQFVRSWNRWHGSIVMDVQEVGPEDMIGFIWRQ
jgi:hypothetical protein